MQKVQRNWRAWLPSMPRRRPLRMPRSSRRQSSRKGCLRVSLYTPAEVWSAGIFFIFSEISLCLATEVICLSSTHRDIHPPLIP